MKSFWFISSLMIIMVSCNNFICSKSPTQIPADRKAVTGYLDTINVIKFQTLISFRETELSGILIFKKMTDSTSAGSFINEFGLKGFDFSISPDRAKLGYTFRKLDKWYIRRTLETDLHFMFSKPGPFTRCVLNKVPVSVVSVGSSLHYVYYTPDQPEIGHADMYRRSRKISGMVQFYTSPDGFKLKMEHTNGSRRYELVEIKN
jgi:hypothetical protein